VDGQLVHVNIHSPLTEAKPLTMDYLLLRKILQKNINEEARNVKRNTP
jgi:hypothetical protein